MTSTVQSIENLTLNIAQEIHVRASLDATFAALLEEMGPRNETPEGKPLPMKIEARPGAGGIATWAKTTVIFGELCRPSSGRHCSRSAGRCSCPIRSYPTCSTG